MKINERVTMIEKGFESLYEFRNTTPEVSLTCEVIMGVKNFIAFKSIANRAVDSWQQKDQPNTEVWIYEGNKVIIYLVEEDKFVFKNVPSSYQTWLS